MEYRIEQLAAAARVAVDTVRFYQGKGLIASPRRQGRVTWYADEHLARLRRIRALQERGFSLAVIRRFLAGELEPSDEALVAAVTSPDPGAETLSLEELAKRGGVPVSLLQTMQDAGLLVRAAGDAAEPRFPASDVEALAAGMRLLEAGIPLSDLLVLAGEHAAAVERTARRAVELFDKHVRERLQANAGADDVSAELLRRFDQMMSAGEVLVHHHFRQTVLRVAQEHIEQPAQDQDRKYGPSLIRGPVRRHRRTV